MLGLSSIVFGCCDIAHAYMSSGEISILGLLALALAVADVGAHHYRTRGHEWREVFRL